MSALFDYFNRIEKESWSGEVDITSSQGHATVVVKDGHLLMTHRPLDRMIERLQKLEWIKTPPKQLLQDCKTWDAIYQEYLTENAEHYVRLVQHIKTDRLELFYRVFFWTNVELSPRPYNVQVPDPATLGFLSFKRFSNLLREAQKRLEEWPQIQSKIGSSKRVFICQVQLPSETSIDPIDQSLEKLEMATGALPYSAEQILLLRLSDGRNSVQDIVRLSMDGEFLTLRRIVDLWRKGALRPKDDAQTDSQFKFELPLVSWRDLAMALGLAFVISAGGFFLESLPTSGERATGIEWTQALQALDLQRRETGNYPLSLAELMRSSKIPAPPDAQKFAYTLRQPGIYELRPKTNY